MKYNPIPAVEVDGPGCSYNPDPVNHQEALAVAVAAEVRKAMDREMTGLYRLSTNFTGRIDFNNLDELELLQVGLPPQPPEGCGFALKTPEGRGVPLQTPERRWFPLQTPEGCGVPLQTPEGCGVPLQTPEGCGFS